MWMSLARERMPSEMMRSTRRTTGRWLASSSVILISSTGASSASCTISADDSIPDSSLLIALSGRYSSSSRALICDGASRSSRTSRAVANAKSFSACISKGLAVATSI